MRKTNSTHRMKLFGVDDLLIGALVGGAGSLFTNFTNSSNVANTNAFNAQNVAMTNATNKEIADNANKVSIEEAAKNRDFQERLSNSAYQRSMQDMAKAGLNPILAYQKGGASTPTGGQPSITAAKMEAARAQPFEAKNVAADAVNTALSLQRAQQENHNAKLTADNILANTAKTMAETTKTGVQSQILGEELKPAQLAAVRADIDKSVYGNSAMQTARKAGTIAQEGERTVAPLVNSAKSLTQAILPWKSYETTKSGSRWNNRGEENHYQESTFNSRFKGW